jgi:Flp pilus assembly pilin Flp
MPCGYFGSSSSSGLPIMRRRLTFVAQRSEPTAAEYGLIVAVLVLAIGISLHGLAGKTAAVLGWIAGTVR